MQHHTGWRGKEWTVPWSVLIIVLCLAPTSQAQCFSASEKAALGITPTERDGASITLQRYGWRGHEITTTLGQIVLSELMGYNAVIKVFTDASFLLFEHIANGDADVNLEVWSSGKEAQVLKYVTQQASVTVAGQLGVNGQSGWFIPSYLVSEAQYTYQFFDFWRSLPRRETVATYPLYPSINTSLYVDPPFVPQWCTAPNACMEIVGQRSSYDTGYIQQQIRNLGLNATMVFVGDNPAVGFQSRLDSKQAFVFYSWRPSKTTLDADALRITFPAFSELCVSNNTNNLNGYGSVDCDFPFTPLDKVYRTELDNTVELRDALLFIRRMKLDTTQQEDILKLYNGTVAQLPDVVCSWMKANPTVWKPWVVNEGFRRTQISSGLVTVVMGINSALLLFAVACVGMVVYHRKHQIIKATSWEFLCLLGIGAIGLHVSVFVLAETTTSGCRGFLFLFGAALLLVLACLVVKTWRLTMIFSTKINVRAARQLGQMRMYMLIGLALLVEGIIDAVWLVVDATQRSTVTDVSTVEVVSFHQCDFGGQPTIWFLWVLYKTVFILWGVMLAFQSRFVPGLFSEAKAMGLTLYNMAFCGMIATPLLFNFSGELDADYVVKAFGIMWVAGFTVSVIYLPKLYYTLPGKVIPSEYLSTTAHARHSIDKSFNRRPSSEQDRRRSPSSVSEMRTIREVDSADNIQA